MRYTQNWVSRFSVCLMLTSPTLSEGVANSLQLETTEKNVRVLFEMMEV
jgi:hypothetical protein